MLPLRDDNPTRTFPLVTVLLILANVAVFAYQVQLALAGGLDPFVERYAFDFGAFSEAVSRGRLDLAAATPLFTHMFLHSGPVHVIGNMLYLWVFGNNIEDRLGGLRFVLFYLACGVAAAIGQGLIQPAPMVGASGAVAGVLGAYVLLFPRTSISTLVLLGLFITVVHLPALVVIGFWIVLQVLSGLAELQIAQSNVAYFAHIAGFFAGILLLQVLRPARRYASW